MRRVAKARLAAREEAAVSGPPAAGARSPRGSRGRATSRRRSRRATRRFGTTTPGPSRTASLGPLPAGDFYDEAIRAATAAIELDPDCAPAYLALGLAYDRRGGMWDQSILVWHELAEVVPDLVTAHVQLGEAFAAAAFDEEAIEAWRAALELDPAEARAMYNLAVAALKREGMATALPGFRKAGELDPSQDDFFFALAGIDDDGTPAPDPDEVPADREARLRGASALARERGLLRRRWT